MEKIYVNIVTSVLVNKTVKKKHMTLVKSAPKKSFSQKTILPIENLLKS